MALDWGFSDWDWDDILGSAGELGGSIWDSLNDQEGFELLDLLALGIGGANAAGWLDSDQEKVGYQGKIPDYTAVRARVPMGPNATNPDRRPGEYGQRYFTDTMYAKTPEGGGQPMSLEDAQAESVRQQFGLAAGNKRGYAGGGLASLNAYYAGGPTDGMADGIPALINGQQPAAMSHGEFVMPADIVSHLGNGNSEAGAQQLYNMMDRIRQARTGTSKQGKQIDPNKLMPA